MCSKKHQDKLDKIDLKIVALCQEKGKLINEMIEGCSHPLEKIMELPYFGTNFNTEAPWLICSECGYTEEGWGCGYKKLRHGEYQNVPKISRETWFKMRKRSVFQNGHTV